MTILLLAFVLFAFGLSLIVFRALRYAHQEQIIDDLEQQFQLQEF